ncbi:MAG: methionine adenosyltransferase [Rhodospirillales bacterium]|nr:methionine adenosyltransferase [Rhodospirillales bacterium]
MKEDFIFTSESVTAGHPDKLCDGISDAIVDRFMQQDPFSKIVVESVVATGILFLAARFASKATVDLPGVARQVVHDAGYEDEGFNPKTCSVMTSLNELPREERSERDEREMDDDEIERLVVDSQATVFGFACGQTPALMPLPIWLAHKLARRLAAVREGGDLAYLAPDGKTQVSVEYRHRRARRIHGLTLIAASKGGRPVKRKQLHDDLMEHVVKPVFHDEPVGPDHATRIFINPFGPVLIGGPAVHAGLTGRKTGVDTYGEYARQSGSALSGKDPSRIDRVGAYMARYAAKNVVRAGLASECEVQLSYSIGLARPVSTQVETFGTGRIPDREIAARITRAIDFRLAGIIRQFNLRFLPSRNEQGFYRRLAAYGHVGRLDLETPWERTDKVDALQAG